MSNYRWFRLAYLKREARNWPRMDREQRRAWMREVFALGMVEK